MLKTDLKIAYIKKNIIKLATSPAWSGQVECLEGTEKNTLTIQVRNRFVRDWVRENFLPKVQEDLKEIPGDELTLQVVVATSPIEPHQLPELPEKIEKTMGALPPEPVKEILHDTLKLKYSFENFVIGTSNQFAHAAASAVAKLPVESYNPLFIYGGVGLGKTHLLNAIGLQILKNNPRSRIICISSEKFTNELIYCLRFEKMSDFRKKYRNSCDVLLVDDIQFIAGKERTQEEFFHTFNHLHDSQKQIVLTSDKPPREIPDLEERLRSRFEWGLIADLQIPDLETRAAIVQKKAAVDGIEIDNEVALFLATYVKSNIRELEGSLIRVHAFATLSNTPITVSLAKDVLKNVLASVERILTVEQVQKLVCEFYSVKMADLIGKKRIRSLALPRQIAMYLCRKHVKSSFPEIGDKFGKDHSTVVHAFGKIEGCIEKDHVIRDQIQNLEKTLTR